MFLSMMLGVALAATATQAKAQTKPTTGSIHGHVTSGVGIPISGTVKMTTDLNPSDPLTAKYKYELPVDDSGNYTNSAIEPGTYLAVFFREGKTADFQTNIRISAGADITVDFDMTRKEWQDKLTPEQKQAQEEFKKQMAATQAENAKIGNLNQMLGEARDAMKARDFDKAADLMQKCVAQKPEEGLLQYELANAQSGQKKYDDAVTSYKKAIELNDASKKPKTDLDAAAYNNLGQALAMEGKPAEAATAYETAAKLAPNNAVMYYTNEAATFYNHGDTDNAAVAAQKAISIDPTGRPDLYYVLGQSLIPKATVDAAGKIVAPPGCAEAYQKYLQLSPQGVHVQEVKDILAGMSQNYSTPTAKPKKGK
jgi:tetratricopeptide (TPR) repeat protein